MAFEPDDTELAVFVTNSNHIEGIWAGPTDKLYFGHHVAAAKFVRSAKALLPIDGLQAMIMFTQLEAWQLPGDYRTETASFGYRDMPLPHAVRVLMTIWHEECSKLLEHYAAVQLGGDELAAAIVRLHSFALCVHPFPDGNGRTFRLFFNHLRQRCGLPWILFDPQTDEWHTLLAELRDYETRVFRPTYAWAYLPAT